VHGRVDVRVRMAAHGQDAHWKSAPLSWLERSWRETSQRKCGRMVKLGSMTRMATAMASRSGRLVNDADERAAGLPRA